MKKILTQPIEAKFEFHCDKCEKVLEFGPDVTINFDFGYGSDRDGDKAELHLCGDCGEKMHEWLEGFTVKKIELVNSFDFM